MARSISRSTGGAITILAVLGIVTTMFSKELAKELFFGLVGDTLRAMWPDISPLATAALQYGPWIILLAVGVMGITGWGARKTVHRHWPYLRSPKNPTTIKSKRISLLDLSCEAENKGWRILDPSCLHSLDLFDGLRQAALDEDVKVYGKPVHQFEQLTANEPLQFVPTDHWRTHELSIFGLLRFNNRGEQTEFAPDNYFTVIKPLAGGSETYRDIHLERNQALAWLDRDGPSFRGNRDARVEKRNEDQQQASQADRRNVHLQDAIWRVSTGSWNFDKNSVLSDPDSAIDAIELGRTMVFQAALDGDLPIWGQPYTGHYFKPIPKEYWESHDVALTDVCGCEDAAKMITESRAGSATTMLYDNLRTNRELVDKLWPSENT